MTFVAPAVYLVYVGALFGFVYWASRRPGIVWESPWPLGEWPSFLKVAATLPLLSYALVHSLSAWEVFLKTRTDFSSAGEYFYYMSLPKLVATSHAHLFGHATMYGLTSAVFSMTRLRGRAKTFIIGAALCGGLIDVPSWWMMKYYGDKWEAFAALSGALYSAGWAIMAGRILWELWGRREGGRLRDQFIRNS
ncbi:MAG: hypothetical protein HY547_01840 [Elusimicrobia bacterium]|nr:hypothetical protein [Elusimicrobiota bacterium]